MDDFIRRIFTACDKDQDGYLDRADLEEVRKQIGLEGNISEILEQFGAADSGKISFQQFYANSSALFGDLNQSSSDSSPDYCTDTEAQQESIEKRNNQLLAEILRNDQAQQEERSAFTSVAPSGVNMSKDTKRNDDYAAQQRHALNLQLEVSNEKIKKINEMWDTNVNPLRKSGGGMEDYLDQKTLLHLEKLKIYEPPSDEKQSLDAFQTVPDEHETGLLDLATEPDYLEMFKKLHLAALTQYKNEIAGLRQKNQHLRKEKEQLRKEKTQWQQDRHKIQQDFEDKLQSQTMRITELQSVIAELTRKLNNISDSKIIEEEEEDNRSASTSDMEVQGSNACSECSCCDNCEHQHDDGDEAGPNQVNYLATTHEGDNLVDSLGGVKPKIAAVESETNDLSQQLSLVLGALESRIEKKTPAMDEEDTCDGGSLAGDSSTKASGLMARHVSPKHTDLHKNEAELSQLEQLLKQVDALKRDKKTLEKQLYNMNVQGYVYQKGNNPHVEDEFTKLRQENNYVRSKLRKSEQELEELKAANINIREDREKLKKKNRLLQDAIDHNTSPSSTLPGNNNGHTRSHSTHLDRPLSPKPMHRSTSSSFDVRSSQRSNSLESGHQRQRSSPAASRRSSDTANTPSPSHSTANLPQFNEKGYAVSPENSLRRGSRLEHTSDLGSSIGDAHDPRNEIKQTLKGILRGRVPETLLNTLLTYTRFDQVLKTLVHHFIAEVEDRTREANINMERLESRLLHLQSQNDLLLLNLDESKNNSERLSLLCGKYESNSTAWSLAVQNTEQMIETYEVMLQLQETEADIFAANCQAAGISNCDTMKSLTSTRSSQSNLSIASSSSHPQGCTEDEFIFDKRRGAETQAKLLLHKLDKKYDGVEDINKDEAYQSRTSTNSSQNSTATDALSTGTDALSKDEEHRLREYIRVLRSERDTFKGTVVELESVHEYSDQLTDQPSVSMDLETAVVLQEMQALKEERAELKHRIYLLEKEKRALELKMSSRDAQEHAYVVTIEHLKSELKEQVRKRKLLAKERKTQKPHDPALREEDTVSMGSNSTHSTNNPGEKYPSSEELPTDEVTRSELHLKTRINELVETLAKLTKNSEIRHKETSEYITDLKRANGALVTAYEKAKKRHAARLKKFEQQLVQMAEKYQMQVRVLKEQIAVLKDTPPSTNQMPHTETSL